MKCGVGTVVGSRACAVVAAAGECPGSVGDQTVTCVAFHRVSLHREPRGRSWSQKVRLGRTESALRNAVPYGL